MMERNQKLGRRAWLVPASVLFGALALLTLPRLSAQAQAPAPAAGMGTSVHDKLVWVGQQLNLRPDQKKKIQPFLTRCAAQVKAIKEDPNLSPEQKKAKSLVAAQSAGGNIRTILDPQQKAKLDEIKEQFYLKMMAQRSGQPAHAGKM
jgi:hypothetical protein